MANNQSDQVVKTWPQWMQNYRLTSNSPKKEQEKAVKAPEQKELVVALQK